MSDVYGLDRRVDGCTECGTVVWDWDRHVLWHGLSDTTRIPSDPPQCPSKPPNPSDTTDPPSVGTVESVSPQSEQVKVDKGEG